MPENDKPSFLFYFLAKGSSTFEESQSGTEMNIASAIITRDGGVVDGYGIKLVCPLGAVDKPVHIKITLEDPSKFYGLIVQKDLENDVIFCGPIINLHPNGHLFQKPVTLTSNLNMEDVRYDHVLILHGKEAIDGKISWEDITHASKIDVKNGEVNIEMKRFSFITALRRMTLIRTKEIVTRLNVWAFNYKLAVLHNMNLDEIALLFVSRDVYGEKFYRECETSALVQLKAEGYRELRIRFLDEHEERRIYNHENLKVAVRLGEDYKVAEGNDNHSFAVESYVWWNTGHVMKLSLEGTKDVRILCGKISVEGEYGHNSKGYFCEPGELESRYD